MTTVVDFTPEMKALQEIVLKHFQTYLCDTNEGVFTRDLGDLFLRIHERGRDDEKRAIMHRLGYDQ